MDLPALRSKGTANGAGDGPDAVLSLALFILLLAFFILLNSMSVVRDDKARSVIDSVDRAFAGAGGRDVPTGDVDRAGLIADAATALRQMGDQALSEIPLARFETRTMADGDRMILVVPTTELFTADGAVRADRELTVARIAGVTGPRPGGLRVTLDALFALPPGGDADAATALAGTLARALAAAGTPVAALGVGLEPVPTGGTVRLMFALLEPGGAAVRLAPGAAP